MRFPSVAGQCGLRSVCVSRNRRHGGREGHGATPRRAIREGRWRDTHLLKSSTRYSISCGRGERGEGQDRRRLRVREIPQRSDHGGRARLSARTVVAFENTCCIMASFSAGESLDMSTGVPCCAIVTPAARRRSGDFLVFRSKKGQLARPNRSRSIWRHGVRAAREATRLGSGVLFGQGAPPPKERASVSPGHSAARGGDGADGMCGEGRYRDDFGVFASNEGRHRAR